MTDIPMGCVISRMMTLIHITAGSGYRVLQVALVAVMSLPIMVAVISVPVLRRTTLPELCAVVRRWPSGIRTPLRPASDLASRDRIIYMRMVKLVDGGAPHGAILRVHIQLICTDNIGCREVPAVLTTPVLDFTYFSHSYIIGTHKRRSPVAYVGLRCIDGLLTSKASKA